MLEKIGSYATLSQVNQIIEDIRQTTGKYQSAGTASRKLRELVQAGLLETERRNGVIVAYYRPAKQIKLF